MTIFNYSKLYKTIGLEGYDPNLKGKLMGIANYYSKLVSDIYDTECTGKYKVDGITIKYPITLDEKLRIQNMIVAAKIKLLEKLRGDYSKKELFKAFKSYCP